MRFVRISLLTGVLVASSARAAEAGPAAAEAARQAMREAMTKQAAMPVSPPTMPMMKPGGSAPAPERAVPEKVKSDAAHHKAMGSGIRDADAVRAEMANQAARGGAMGTMKQTSGDMMNAPMMQRSQGMDPGGGMMPGGATGGGGTGMGPGGMGPGGMGGGMHVMDATPSTTPATVQPPSAGR
jgi:hypothetical protein